MNNFIKFFVSLALPILVGFFGSLVTTPSISSWYFSLNKPFFNPPNWIFGPVWTVLYLLMGVSFYLVWVKGFKEKRTKTAVVLFFVQLGLNFFWSLIFFGLHLPLLAFFEIIILWFFILLLLFYFLKLSKAAGYLLIPYLLWVSFAAILNLSVVILNR